MFTGRWRWDAGQALSIVPLYCEWESSLVACVASPALSTFGGAF